MRPPSIETLAEYQELDYFVEEYGKIQKRDTIINNLRLVEAIRTAMSSLQGKKGGQFYTQWRHGQLDLLKPEEKKATETIFDRLKKPEKKKTIFDRLRKE